MKTNKTVKMALTLTICALTGCALSENLEGEKQSEAATYLPVKVIVREAPVELPEALKEDSVTYEHLESIGVSEAIPYTCLVTPGSLWENLERITTENGRDLTWLIDGDFTVSLGTSKEFETYQDCISAIVTSFQMEGAAISATERDNAIVIRER